MAEAPGPSSPAHGRFPYHIPGPAGSDFNAVTNTFDYDNWHFFLREHGMKPYGPNRLEFSVSQLIAKSLQRDYTKVRIAARVSLISYTEYHDDNGIDPVVVLRDGTCSIRANVPCDLLEDPGFSIKEGTVLVLKDVCPVLNMAAIRPGFRVDYAKAIHFRFDGSNIENLYGARCARPSPSKVLTLQVYKNPVATDREFHVSLLRRLRTDFLVDAEERLNETIRLHNIRRGAIPRPDHFRS